LQTGLFAPLFGEHSLIIAENEVQIANQWRETTTTDMMAKTFRETLFRVILLSDFSGKIRLYGRL